MGRGESCARRGGRAARRVQASLLASSLAPSKSRTLQFAIHIFDRSFVVFSSLTLSMVYRTITDDQRAVPFCLQGPPATARGTESLRNGGIVSCAVAPKVRIKVCHMLRADMLKHAVQSAVFACMAHTVDRDIALHIKHGFDALYGGKWHCVVGSSFGSGVSHEEGLFFYAYIDPGSARRDSVAVLLWRAGGTDE